MALGPTFDPLAASAMSGELTRANRTEANAARAHRTEDVEAARERAATGDSGSHGVVRRLVRWTRQRIASVRRRQHGRNAAMASGPHAFAEPEDPRLGLALSGNLNFGQMGPSAGLLVAGVTNRAARCALPGCGRVRSDPIHWPAE